MAEVVPDVVLREVAAMSDEGKRALIACVREMLEAPRGDGVPGRCPRCGCAHVVRKGRGRDGSQRWLCRGCGSTFCAGTLSVAGQSRLPLSTWLDFAEGMADGLTLRQLARRCGVCLKTSWFMRMRVCEAMGARLDPFVSGPGVAVEVDGTMLHESLSGNGRRGGFAMPRPPRRCYRDLHVSGVSGQLACVVCGASDRGGAFCRVVGRAHGTDAGIRSALEGRLAPGTRGATDDLPAYRRVLPGLGVEHEVRPAGGRSALGLVNALHKRLADFLRPFNGVSTRRLQRYLDWFCWLEQFRGSGVGRQELVRREARSGGYRTTRAGLFREPRAFMDYWERKQVYVSTEV